MCYVPAGAARWQVREGLDGFDLLQRHVLPADDGVPVLVQDETINSRQMRTDVAYGGRCTRCWKEAVGPKHLQLGLGLLCKEHS